MSKSNAWNHKILTWFWAGKPAFISDIQTLLGKGSGWIINSVLGHYFNFSKYNALDGSSYQITKRIRPSKERFD